MPKIVTKESSARIIAELQACAAKTHIAIPKTAKLHVAVMSEPFLSAVFAGSKTVESRFSLHRIAPYQKVSPGDIVFMKAGPVVGCFTISWVKYFDLTTHPIAAIAREFGSAIGGDKAFWRRKSTKNYATLMGIQDVRHILPCKISKFDRSAWRAL
jgi:hypothetical protein